MKKTIATLALAFSIVAPAAACADTNTGLENVLLVEQLADVATTQACAAAAPVPYEYERDGNRYQGYRRCVETDPIALPFVKTPLLNVAAALSVNGIVRLIPGSRTKLTILKIFTYVYPVVSIHNVGVIVNLRR